MSPVRGGAGPEHEARRAAKIAAIREGSRVVIARLFTGSARTVGQTGTVLKRASGLGTVDVMWDFPVRTAARSLHVDWLELLP